MLQNRMFDGSKYRHFGDSSYWLEPYQTLREEGLKSGISFDTEDVVHPKDANILLCMEMPERPDEIYKLKKLYPNLKVILQILETPLGRRWTFDPKNHKFFDAVLTYNKKLKSRKGYFIYNIPAGGLDGWRAPANELSWHDRRMACMVSNAPNCAPRIPRRSGLGMIRAGWHFNLSTWLNYITEGGSLYRQRLLVAEILARQLGESFNIYGPGWAEVLSEEVKSAAEGVWEGNKIKLLSGYRFNIAYENCLNDCGYVSEKIFDAFLAGCVPVYIGNKSIKEVIPADAFIDGRQFGSVQQMGVFLSRMTNNEWTKMKMAGTEFVRNGAKSIFGAEQYTCAVLAAVRHVSRPAEIL